MSMLIDEVAEAIHDAWWEYKRSQGVVYGTCRTDKMHPHMLPWKDCGLENNNQDRYQACMVLHFLGTTPGLDLGSDETRQAVARLLHDSFCEAKRLQGYGDHPHCGPWAEMHKEGPEEHESQATRVCELLHGKGFTAGMLSQGARAKVTGRRASSPARGG